MRNNTCQFNLMSCTSLLYSFHTSVVNKFVNVTIVHYNFHLSRERKDDEIKFGSFFVFCFYFRRMANFAGRINRFGHAIVRRKG